MSVLSCMYGFVTLSLTGLSQFGLGCSVFSLVTNLACFGCCWDRGLCWIWANVSLTLQYHNPVFIRLGNFNGHFTWRTECVSALILSVTREIFIGANNLRCLYRSLKHAFYAQYNFPCFLGDYYTEVSQCPEGGTLCVWFKLLRPAFNNCLPNTREDYQSLLFSYSSHDFIPGAFVVQKEERHFLNALIKVFTIYHAFCAIYKRVFAVGFYKVKLHM
jgi:hypothetical protein